MGINARSGNFAINVPPDKINHSGIKMKRAPRTERKDLFEVESAESCFSHG